MIPDADGRSPVLGDYPVEGLLPEYFVGGVIEEGLGDLLPIAVLLIDHLGDRLDGIVAVHEPERLDALFGETDSNGPTDAAAGASDNGDLPTCPFMFIKNLPLVAGISEILNRALARRASAASPESHLFGRLAAKSDRLREKRRRGIEESSPQDGASWHTGRSCRDRRARGIPAFQSRPG